MQSLYTEILQTAEEKLEFRRKNSEIKNKTELRQRNQQSATTDDIDTRPDILPQVFLLIFFVNI